MLCEIISGVTSREAARMSILKLGRVPKVSRVRMKGAGGDMVSDAVLGRPITSQNNAVVIRRISNVSLLLNLLSYDQTSSTAYCLLLTPLLHFVDLDSIMEMKITSYVC